jgi:hypothetical protein
LPFAAFLESPLFAAVYLGIAPLVVLVVVIRHRAAANPRPGVDEHGMALLAASAYSASMSFMGLLAYGAVYGVAWLLRAVVAALSLGWSVDPAAAAAWVAGPFALLFGLAALAVSPVPRTLYPEVAGVVSAYDGLPHNKTVWLLLLLTGAGVALSVVIHLWWPAQWGWHLMVVFMLVGAGGEAMRTVSNWSPALALGSEALHALNKLYRSLGYTTVESPRTKDGDPDIDSLLKAVDLLATRDQEALVIALHTPSRSRRAVSAADASILPIAARAMERQLGPDAHSVQPMLVLVGRDPGADLARMAQAERIRVLLLGEDMVRKAMTTDDPAVLRALAQKYLVDTSGLLSVRPAGGAGAGLEA